MTDATDFNNGLYLADGSIVTMGPQVIFHTGTMSTVIRSIIERYQKNPGIRDGDMFILNDPYKGAIHQPDVSIVAPIFSKGRLIAWAGSCAHQLDTGGMSFGSWAYSATDVQQEAMLLPGVKIVENGEVREDIWQMIMGMTRLPDVVGLDLKGMIAANNVAARRLHELFDRYGEDTVVDVMHAEIDASERSMRERLRSLPDGIYRARDYIDHDGLSNALYRVCLAVEKRGDELTFDMTGTSPQAPGFINCTWSGMKGALLTGLLPILAPDIRWNEGVLRPVTIRAPEGIVCNASWPAPVSGATISTVWIVMNVAVAALSRLVSMTEKTVGEAQAVTKGQMSVLTFGGRDRDGSKFGAFLLDSMAGGGGASINQDGLDGSGDYDVPRPSIANVEANESSSPILYLFRSFVPDTGGPGRMRGGATTSVGLTPHDVDGFDATLVGHGIEVPNSTGLFGGLPGAVANHYLMQSNIDSAELLDRYASADDVMRDPGARDIGAKPGSFHIGRGDVLAYTFQGGADMAIPCAAIRSASRVMLRPILSRANPRKLCMASCCGTMAPSTSARPKPCAKKCARRASAQSRSGNRRLRQHQTVPIFMSARTGISIAAAARITGEPMATGRPRHIALSCRRPAVVRISDCIANSNCAHLPAPNAARCLNSRSAGRMRTRSRPSSFWASTKGGKPEGRHRH